MFGSEAFDEHYEYDDEYDPFDNEELDIDETVHKQEFIKKSFKGILDAERKEIKNRLKSQYEKHKVINPELENIIADMISKRLQVQRIWAKREFTGGGTYYQRGTGKIVLNVTNDEGEYAETMSNLFHEAGHALDEHYGNKDYKRPFYSTSYISSKYGTNLASMLKDEISKIDIEEYKKQCNLINGEMRAKYRIMLQNGEIDEMTKINERRRLYDAYLRLVDTIQGTFGLEYCKEHLGDYTHNKGYFDSKYDWYNDINRGTEFFAEMTDDLINDHEHHFSNYMKKVAPKSVEIYFEILKEVYGYHG